VGEGGGNDYLVINSQDIIDEREGRIYLIAQRKKGGERFVKEGKPPAIRFVHHLSL